jgi:hypothetical protein
MTILYLVAKMNRKGIFQNEHYICKHYLKQKVWNSLAKEKKGR